MQPFAPLGAPSPDSFVALREPARTVLAMAGGGTDGIVAAQAAARADRKTAEGAAGNAFLLVLDGKETTRRSPAAGWTNRPEPGPAAGTGGDTEPDSEGEARSATGGDRATDMNTDSDPAAGRADGNPGTTDPEAARARTAPSAESLPGSAATEARPAPHGARAPGTDPEMTGAPPARDATTEEGSRRAETGGATAPMGRWTGTHPSPAPEPPGNRHAAAPVLSEPSAGPTVTNGATDPRAPSSDPFAEPAKPMMTSDATPGPGLRPSGPDNEVAARAGQPLKQVDPEPTRGGRPPTSDAVDAGALSFGALASEPAAIRTSGGQSAPVGDARQPAGVALWSGKGQAAPTGTMARGDTASPGVYLLNGAPYATPNAAPGGAVAAAVGDALQGAVSEMPPRSEGELALVRATGQPREPAAQGFRPLPVGVAGGTARASSSPVVTGSASGIEGGTLPARTTPVGTAAPQPDSAAPLGPEGEGAATAPRDAAFGGARRTEPAPAPAPATGTMPQSPQSPDGVSASKSTATVYSAVPTAAATLPGPDQSPGVATLTGRDGQRALEAYARYAMSPAQWSEPGTTFGASHGATRGSAPWSAQSSAQAQWYGAGSSRAVVPFATAGQSAVLSALATSYPVDDLPMALAPETAAAPTAQAHAATAAMQAYTPASQTAQAIAAQLAAATRLTGAQSEIALSPEELGRVRLRMHSSDGVLHVSVLVERPETLDLMRRHLSELGQEFAREGYADVSFSFEQAGGDTGSGPEDGAPNSADAPVRTIGTQADTTPQPPSDRAPRKTVAGTLDLRL